MKRKTENPHGQLFAVRSDGLQLLGRQHAVECFHQRGQRDRQRDVVQQPTQVLERVRNALEEMLLAFIKAAKTIRTQRLHDADVNIRVVVLEERIAIERDETG